MRNTLRRTLALMFAMLLLMSFATTAFATAHTKIHRTLYYGDNGDDVKQIQKKLKALGYFKGNIGGNYLDLTQNAVRKFQKAYGYTRTYYCSEGMQKKILNAKAKDDIYRTIHYGDNGEDVKAIQRKLKKLGFFDGTIGGNYLKKTRAAVKAYQRAHNYKQTDYCSVSMQYAILGVKMS